MGKRSASRKAPVARCRFLVGFLEHLAQPLAEVMVPAGARSRGRKLTPPGPRQAAQKFKFQETGAPLASAGGDPAHRRCRFKSGEPKLFIRFS